MHLSDFRGPPQTDGGYRLPSEAEWEYAARAGTETPRYWGHDSSVAYMYGNGTDRSLMMMMGAPFDPARFHDCDDGFPCAAPVGSFQPNPFGLHDMLGNVWEFCADHWRFGYGQAPGDSTALVTGGDSTRLVMRGGSWRSGPQHLRSGVRKLAYVLFRHDDVGFRVVRDLRRSER